MMDDLRAALVLHFDPIAPTALLSAFAVMATILLVAALVSGRRRGLGLRVLSIAAFLCVLANPSLVREERRSVRDVVALVLDSSPSNATPKRSTQARAAFEYLKEKLENREDLDLRTLEAPAAGEADAITRTRLFEPLAKTLSDVPRSRRGGVILITDGQIHDVPRSAQTSGEFGPIHALLTGERNEKDRRIVIVEAPAYGVIGQTVRVRFRIEDRGNGLPKTASVTLRSAEDDPQTLDIRVGEEQTFVFPVAHAGQNVLEIETPAIGDEISTSNNRAALMVNGVRDRLRVLLVSGVPHAGERMWRDTLTSDPGVDLIHFTILRDPNKVDFTPSNEMSLIAFPFHELFEEKLADFDLIILDRYQRNETMPDFYFGNIARYIERGGALLLSVGPEFAKDDVSVYRTAFSDILPARPDGQVYTGAFRPERTPTGQRHPVTAGLQWHEGAPWGQWHRQVGLETLAQHRETEILMQGNENRPLLILSRQGKGRIAQIASDQLWLWARGYDGGGPHADLIRRIAHWLMKEPELEENALDLSVSGNTLTIRRRVLKPDPTPVETILTDPQGQKSAVPLTPGAEGWEEARTTVSHAGVYRVESGGLSRLAIAGEPNAPENADIRATAEKIQPAVSASGGGVIWLSETPRPEIRNVSPGASAAGARWIGIRRNADYTVASVSVHPLIPPWAAASVLVVLALLAWLIESGRKRRKLSEAGL